MTYITTNDFTWSEMGRRIKALRMRRGLAQTDLSIKSHLSSGSISLLEAGLINPKLKTLQQLASALDCTVRYLLCGVDLGQGLEYYNTIGRVITILASTDREAIQTFWGGLDASEVVMQRGYDVAAEALGKDASVAHESGIPVGHKADLGSFASVKYEGATNVYE
jgi:transcriptional regulator with XRE-family HTH domain